MGRRKSRARIINKGSQLGGLYVNPFQTNPHSGVRYGQDEDGEILRKKKRADSTPRVTSAPKPRKPRSTKKTQERENSQNPVRLTMPQMLDTAKLIAELTREASIEELNKRDFPNRTALKEAVRQVVRSMASYGSGKIGKAFRGAEDAYWRSLPEHKRPDDVKVYVRFVRTPLLTRVNALSDVPLSFFEEAGAPPEYIAIIPYLSIIKHAYKGCLAGYSITTGALGKRLNLNEVISICFLDKV